MRIIAIANQKGGCGKTTTAINLSSSLSIKGKKVLLIDCDPQAHATLGLSKNPSALETSLYHVLTLQAHGVHGLEEILMPIKSNFDLAPSSVILSALEQELVGIEGRETRLLQAIRALRIPYDYVVIDCPPSIGLLCMNALRACDEVIIPIDMSLFSLRGVAKLTEIILLFKEKVDHIIKPRALVTMFDIRTRYSKHVLQKVRETFGSNVFESVVRYNIRLRETVDSGVPIGDYDKHSIGFKDYENLADELIRSESLPLDDSEQDISTAEDMLTHTEQYIESVAQSTTEEPPAGGPVAEEEEETTVQLSGPSQWEVTLDAKASHAADGIIEEEGDLEAG